MLETKVADFARAPNDEDDGSSDGGEPPANALPAGARQAPAEPYGYAGGSSGTQYYSPSQYEAGRQYAGGLALPNARADDVRVKAEPEDVIRPRGGAVSQSNTGHLTYTLQANDGASLTDSKPEPNAAGLFPGDEVIDSDLDDSEGELDDDVDGGEDANTDYVFCVYDKVSIFWLNHSGSRTKRYRYNASRTSGRLYSRTA